MQKVETWWEDLNDYILSCQSKSIDWDTFDCCQFICGCCEAMTGQDPYKEFGYKYNTKSMAIQAVKAFASVRSYNQGVKYIVRSIGLKLGAEEGSRPRRGDIVVLDCAGEYICGCVLIGKIAVIDENKGLQYVPIDAYDIKLIVRSP